MGKTFRNERSFDDGDFFQKDHRLKRQKKPKNRDRYGKRKFDKRELEFKRFKVVEPI